MKDKVKRLHTISMDGGYRGEDFAHWIIDVFRWIVEVVLRPLEKEGFYPFTKTLRCRTNFRVAQLV